MKKLINVKTGKPVSFGDTITWTESKTVGNTTCSIAGSVVVSKDSLEFLIEKGLVKVKKCDCGSDLDIDKKTTVSKDAAILLERIIDLQKKVCELSNIIKYFVKADLAVAESKAGVLNDAANKK